MKLYGILVFVLYARISTPLPPPADPTSEMLGEEHANINDKRDETRNEDVHKTEGKTIEDDLEYPPIVRNANDRLDVDRLRQKCMHLSKLLNLNKRPEKTGNFETNDDYRPVYVTTQKPTQRPSSFYVTIQPESNKLSIPAASAIKYIRLEPVILQKTILNNGRTVYYWHKNLPTSLEYPDKREDPSYDYYPPLYHNFKPSETATETTTTTTTEETGGFGYGLSHLIPFYGGAEPTSTTTGSPVKPEEASYKYSAPYDEYFRQTWPYHPYFYAPQLQLVVPKVEDHAEGIDK
ncbi:unnamed protein product [Phyllotreta striolata]|uniref:Uncharacterized protein n=1 Tax=Phyllotreta striolata TaxID=444603 RepID=A0A9N9TZU5_PHYSR|nr:unnamed protein product [Phyllotreta striolata]